MKLTYNQIALHDYGQVVITGETSVGKPEAAPQFWEKQLRVRLMFKEATYADNYALVQQVRQALKSKQQAVLLWEDDNGNQLVNQTATIVAHDRPESPNEKGTYFQTIEITFAYIDVFGATQNNCVQATYQREGVGTTVVTLGYVEGVKYATDVRRYSPFRSHRESASGRIEVRGKFMANAQDTLEKRRADLLIAQDLMKKEINDGKVGKFKFGTIDQWLRVENFTADIDQHVYYITFSLSATFTQFPNEDDYAQAEFTVDTRQDKVEGKQIIALSGTINASTEDKAKAKLGMIRESLGLKLNNTGNGWTMLRGDGGRSERVSGEDGDTFIRYSFDEEFEKTIANLVEWNLRLSDAEDATAGTIRRSYAGYVTATGSSFQGAYSTATQKALALGDNKHAFKLSGSITCDDKQFYDPSLSSSTNPIVREQIRQSQRQTTGPFVVRVEFTYEYRIKGNKVYAEINSEFTGETFGIDTETISGFVSAPTVSEARSIYTTIRNGYASYMVRSERVVESRAKTKATGMAHAGSVASPPELSGVGTTTVNQTEFQDDKNDSPVSSPLARGPLESPRLTNEYWRQWTRLDFSFSIHRPKSSADGQVAVRYDFTISNDYVARERTSTVAGVIWGATEAICKSFLGTYFESMNLGELTNERTAVNYEKAPPSSGAKFNTRVTGSIFTALTFDQTYLSHIDKAGIIKCELRETIKCSGNRNVVQPTAMNEDVLQVCGTQSGVRTISGSCTATSETLAFQWIQKQLALPLAKNWFSKGAGKQNAVNPIQFDIEAETIPLRSLTFRDADGKVYTGAEKAKFARVSFTREELYTEISEAVTPNPDPLAPSP